MQLWQKQAECDSILAAWQAADFCNHTLPIVCIEYGDIEEIWLALIGMATISHCKLYRLHTNIKQAKTQH